MSGDKYQVLKDAWFGLGQMRQWFDVYWSTDIPRGTAVSKYASGRGGANVFTLTKDTDPLYRNVVQEMDTIAEFLNIHDRSDFVLFARKNKLPPPKPPRVLPNPLVPPVPGPNVPPPAAVGFIAPAPKRKPKPPNFQDQEVDSDGDSVLGSEIGERLGSLRAGARKPAGTYRELDTPSRSPSPPIQPSPARLELAGMQPADEGKQSEPEAEMQRKVTEVTDLRVRNEFDSTRQGRQGEPSVSLSRAFDDDDDPFPAMDPVSPGPGFKPSRRSRSRSGSPTPEGEPGEPIRMRREDDNGIFVAVIVAATFLAIAYQLS